MTTWIVTRDSETLALRFPLRFPTQAAAEANAKATGWQRTRHAAHPTTDFAIADVPALAWVARAATRRVLGRMADAFGLDAATLALEDLFIAK